MATPPNDLDRLASAWHALQVFVNSTLPAFRLRSWAVQNKVATTSAGSGPKPV
jgi:hypothetical protein